MTFDASLSETGPIEPEKRADELLGAFFAETLSADEAEELLEIWRQHPRLERIAQENMSVEKVFRFSRDLKRTLTPTRLTEMKTACRRHFALAETSCLGFDVSDPEELSRLAALSPSLSKGGENEADADKRKTARISTLDKTQKHIPLPVIVLSCIMLLGFGIFVEFYPGWNKPGEAFAPVAQVVDSVEAEWEDGAESFKVGQELEATTLRLRSGVVKLEFRNGTDVTLEGPTVLEVKNRAAAFCPQGKLSVFVPPQGKGFQIASPAATVVDLGTAFSLNVFEEQSDVHVVKGKVEVIDATGKKDILPEGIALLLDRYLAPKQTVADPLSFFSETKLRERKRDYAARRREVRRQQGERLETDPSLLYRLEPERASGTFAKVPGSEKGKTALRFRNTKDRLAATVDRECRDLTLIASIRLEDLPDNTGVLVTGDALGLEKGEFLWQINRRGELHFRLDEGQRSVRPFDSPSVVSVKDRKTWQRLAVVADAKSGTVTHYRDGAPVAVIPWERPIPLRADRLSVGNVGPRTKQSTVRHLNGDIEELYLFARPFSASEIRDDYWDSL